MKTLPDSMEKLYQKFSAFKGDMIEFGQPIKVYESQFEAKMRAQLAAIRRMQDDVIILTFDETEWVTYNNDFASADFFDKNGNACLTAKQAGFYHVREDVYVMATDNPNNLFQLIDSGERSLKLNQAQLAYLEQLLMTDAKASAEWEAIHAMVTAALE